MTKPFGYRLTLNTLLSEPLRNQQKETQPRAQRSQRITVHELPETRANRVAKETRNKIQKLSAVVNAVVPPGEKIAILKTRRLGPLTSPVP